MASQLSAKLNIDITGYEKGLNDAKQSTEEYKTQLGDLSKKFPSMRKEMAQTKKAVIDMEVAWRSMSDAQKKSLEGQELQRQLQTLKERGAELKDAIMDVNQEMKNMASDTRQLDAVKQGFDVLGNSISLAANAYAAFTGDSEDAKRALTIFAGVQSTVNTLTALQNALQKQSSLMLAITTAQEKLKTKAIEMDTVAQGKNIVATKGATAAQWAMNAAADANPYVLLASAIIALVGAYAMFSDEINRAIGITNNLTKTQNEVREEMKNLSGQLADNIITTKKLSTEWKELKTEADKKQWIEDNQQAFKDLGIEIINTADAENVFVKNTDKFLEAQHIKMEALAYEAVAYKKLQEAIENGLDADIDPNIFQKWWANAKDSWSKITSGDTQQMSDALMKNTGWGALYNTFSDKGAEMFRGQALDEMNENIKLADKLMKIGDEKRKEYQQKLAEAEISEATNEKPKKPKKSKTNKPDKVTEEAVKGSLADLEKKLSEFQDKYKKGLLPNISAEEYKSQVKKMEDTIKKTKIVLGIEIEPEEGSVKYFKGKISELENEIGNISMYIDVDGKVNPEFIDKLNEIKILKEQALTPDEKLQKQLEESQAKEAEYYRNKAAEQENEKKLLKEKADEQKRIYDAIGQSAQGVGSIMSSISQLAEDESFNTAGIIMEAVANIALSFAKAMKDHKSFSIWDWIAAGIAGTAQMLSMIATIKSATKGYANGGVIEGPFHTGDRMLARVNAGEMILNNRQQRNLFDAIDNGKLQGNNNSFTVESFKVRGSDLYLTMKNYEKTTGKKL